MKTHINYELKSGRELPFFDSLVLSYLKDSVKESPDGKCKVTNKELCEAFGVSQRYVSRTISRLRVANKIVLADYNGVWRELQVVND